MDRMALNPETIPADFPHTDPSLSPAEQVIGWIEEDDHLTRIAREFADGRSKLIGLESGGETEFPGVEGLLECHTKREDFVLAVPVDALIPARHEAITAGEDYIEEYNRVLSRWWEQEQESCE
jgi:hypothetical protein